MAAGDVYKATVVFNNGFTGEFLSFGLHGQQPGASAPTMGNVGDAVKSWWNTNGGGTAWKTHCISDIALAEVKLQRVEPLEAIIQTYTTGLPIVGTGAANTMMAAQNAVLVNMRTAKAGRRFRGRAYLPPPLEGECVNGVIDATVAGDMADQFDGLLTALDGVLFEPVVFSSKAIDDPGPPPTYLPPEANAITSIRIDRRLRSQRRRAMEAGLYVSP